jgi:hypothetical protein
MFESPVNSLLESVVLTQLFGFLPVEKLNSLKLYSAQTSIAVTTNVIDHDEKKPNGVKEYVSSRSSRKSNIIRYRTLKRELFDFETQFLKAHGRNSIDENDKVPMKDKYNEYSQLKNHIRTDASIQIQSLYKGWRCRRNIPAKSKPSLGSQFSETKQSFSFVQAPSSSASSIETIDLESLKAEKSKLKSFLREFDESFKAKHGYEPQKADKISLRAQYVRYQELKTLIERAEKGRVQPVSAPVSVAPAPVAEPPASSAAGLASSSLLKQHTSHPTLPRTLSNSSVTSISGLESTSSSSIVSAPLDIVSEIPSSVTIRTILSNPAYELVSNFLKTNRGSSNTGKPVPTELATSFKAYKRELQGILRTYEDSFFTKNQRKVSLLKDIEPVKELYQRYKDVKSMMTKLELS